MDRLVPGGRSSFPLRPLLLLVSAGARKLSSLCRILKGSRDIFGRRKNHAAGKINLVCLSTPNGERQSWFEVPETPCGSRWILAGGEAYGLPGGHGATRGPGSCACSPRMPTMIASSSGAVVRSRRCGGDSVWYHWILTRSGASAGGQGRRWWAEALSKIWR